MESGCCIDVDKSENNINFRIYHQIQRFIAAHIQCGNKKLNSLLMGMNSNLYQRMLKLNCILYDLLAIPVWRTNCKQTIIQVAATVRENTTIKIT